MATHYGSAGRGGDGNGETFTFVTSRKARWGQTSSPADGSGDGGKARTALLIAVATLLTAGLVHLHDLSTAHTTGIQADAAGRFARGQAVAGLNAAAIKHGRSPLPPAAWTRLIDSRSASCATCCSVMS